ncbi:MULTISPECIES: putative peptidoglycan glycosyltransferase FtsW [Rhodomicrobium]|uniref:FtsW/RodA/SpoVE family cell cycle protein n=1 Tax=Rhodomicrobium TaxID=1068 RepID=UPI000B4B60E1|nr:MULTISPECIES: putative peptidoglycan glycosyltransferase FtsW [Rhodomicrobium]
MRLARTDRSVFTEWWFSVDRLLLGAVLLIMLIGALVSLAASPAAAHKIGAEPLYFFKRHVLYMVPAALFLISASMLHPKLVRRMGLVLFLGGIGLMLLAFAQGIEKNGAVRWVIIGGQSIQPSEFAKAGFIILTAWLFGESGKRRDMPTLQIAIAVLGLFALCLVMQPDIGQTALVVLVWGGLFFLAGYSLIWIGLAILAGAGGFVGAYHMLPHVQSRVDRFLYPASGDTHQTETALAAFREGGWFGRGPGEGVVTPGLPDAYTDYIFAVIAEEFGLIFCLFLVCLYAFIVWRGFRAASRSHDPFIRLALSGLMMLFGFQTLINMAVNVDMLPSKGMTLPFLSYGGSSLTAMALTMGLALGLARRRPEAGPVYRSVPRTASGAASSRGIRI